ncbi:MAG TPA: DUF4307 domain-containing protein [Candidatus Corynebacterium gallistercoris]|uniref:DUF4307 domain-containing protein n=1 Tax=Candidatus Corynebacterium gallistercoris TaxID=2838530 RepID=A0A9D1UQA5_9CORY|nr:DUF4307 domain-containing protein [Candidatus Corynebacterium gallistercoris]
MSADNPTPQQGRPASPQAQTTQERYGNTRNTKFGGKILVLALSVILAAAAAYMVAQLMRAGNVDVSAQETGGEVVSADTLRMSVDVTREDPSKSAFCIVTALDYDKNEVGRREFVIPAGGEDVTRHHVDITTREEAYAGTVYGCSTVLPDYLTGE